MKPGLLPGEGQGGGGGMAWSSHSHLAIPAGAGQQTGWACQDPPDQHVWALAWASWHIIGTIKIIISFRHLHDT